VSAHPAPILMEKSELIGFGFVFGFGFCSMLINGVGADNVNIDTNLEFVPESTPLISNYILSFLN
jgi:hypothetical protein